MWRMRNTFLSLLPLVLLVTPGMAEEEMPWFGEASEAGGRK